MSQVLRLGDVVEKTGTWNPGDQPDAEFVYVDVAAVDNELKRITQPKTMIGADAPSRARKVIRGGDVLVSTVRPNLNAVALVPSSLDEQIASTGFCVLRAKSDLVLPEYLFYYTRTPVFIAGLLGLVAGAMYPAVTDRQVLDQRIPIPSLDEQRRIVDLLSRAEGIVQLRREAHAMAHVIIPALFVDMFGDPSTNPKGWPTKPLRNVAEFRSGGTPSKARPDFWIGDLPWVSPKDMKITALRDAIDRVSRTVLEETSLKLIPPGSVLIVVRGMILVHTVPVAVAEVPLTINQDMKALIPNAAVLPVYLLWALKVMHDRLLGMVSTAAHGTKKLETERLENLDLPLPPLALQQVFAQRTSEMSSILAQQATASTTAADTFASLLAKSFGR